MAEINIAAALPAIRNTPGLHYNNPRVETTIKLPDYAECGFKVYVHGCVHRKCDKFAFNFWKENDSNHVFHFNPRFEDGDVVVRNHQDDGEWGSEERDGGMPFTRGSPFLLAVTAGIDGYQVEVNGAWFTTFSHRSMRLCDITHVNLSGDITIYSLHIPLPPMPIPAFFSIPRNLYVGDMIFVKAEIPQGANKFQLNFAKDSNASSDILFHFNPRFGDGTTVFNDRQGGDWGSEDRMEMILVGPGDKFTLGVVVAKDGFLTYVNGNLINTFAHRQNFEDGGCVFIDEDIRVEDVTIDCAPIRLPPEIRDIKDDDVDKRVAQLVHKMNPLSLKFPKSFDEHSVVYLSGKIDQNPTRFHLNLQSSGENDSDFIAIHFNPRWDDDSGPVTVLNSYTEDGWGEEIRIVNTLQPGGEVQVHILCTEEGYCVVVDGYTVACFPHRGDRSKVNHAYVDGSIHVSRLMVA